MMELKKIEKEYFLNPGELIISEKPLVIKTILGSCIAVCIYDTKNSVGAMCHYLLPESPEKNINSTKYGDFALNLMIKKLLHKYHLKKSDLVAYIVGGAFVIFDQKQIFFIGDRNYEIAKNILDKYKIPIIFSDVLGDKGRKVIFNTSNGDIKVNFIEHMTLEDLYNNKEIINHGSK